MWITHRFSLISFTPGKRKMKHKRQNHRLVKFHWEEIGSLRNGETLRRCGGQLPGTSGGAFSTGVSFLRGFFDSCSCRSPCPGAPRPCAAPGSKPKPVVSFPGMFTMGPGGDGRCEVRIFGKIKLWNIYVKLLRLILFQEFPPGSIMILLYY